LLLAGWESNDNMVTVAKAVKLDTEIFTEKLASIKSSA
jgi:hypothetical protein